MNTSSRYWNICQISLTREKGGYKYRLIETARDFFTQNFSDSSDTQNVNFPNTLFSYFYPEDKDKLDVTYRVDAGFCLRCYVSHSILKACQKIESLFASKRSFTYHDLLPYVLNDDGKTPIILADDSQNPLVLDENKQTKTQKYQFFSLKILQTYNPNSSSSMNLKNWVHLQTKQNKELKKFLSEFGFNDQSDWALMNRVRKKQLASLSPQDRDLIEAFHNVYRRDRREKRSQRMGQCPPPNENQLTEMLGDLKEKNLPIANSIELLKRLKQVATQLRQYDIWSYREPLEFKEPETGNYAVRSDLPYELKNESDLEEEELLTFLHKQFEIILSEAIAQEIQQKISKLKKSKRYSPFANKYIDGLKLYYFEEKSLKQITEILGMNSWDQARRILDPGGLIIKVRSACVTKLFDTILKKAVEKGLADNSPNTDYISVLAKQIELFADTEVFNEAAAEIRTGKHRSLKSPYAKKLCRYLKT